MKTTDILSRLRRKLIHFSRNMLFMRNPWHDYPGPKYSNHTIIRQLCAKLLERSGNRVYAGPFSGMHLFDGCFLATRPMWIVGSYEAELTDAINEMTVVAPSRIIDIGSAYGFYVVGLALAIPSATVVGFEAQEVPHWAETKKLAIANGVSDRVRQAGLCTPATLSDECEPGAFILCDCEGGEVDLLDVTKVPCLKECYILCEVHDFHRTNTTSTLIQRFSITHTIKIIQERAKDPADYRILYNLSDMEKAIAVMETRHVPGRLVPGKFLWMVPKKNMRAGSIPV